MEKDNDLMIVIEKSADLTDFILKVKDKGQSVGFTPTMGALHDGHFSLVRQSILENDISICSIFVNPTQFNVVSDLEKYPRTAMKDADGLRKTGCDVLFLPTAQEIYPHGTDYTIEVDLRGLDLIMEGAMRPGHFEGVVQVVHRLLEITHCDCLYMGQKDYQQFTIIKQMILDLNMPVKLVACPIQREADGLAKSSRNVRLLEINRKKASIIYRVLEQAKEWIRDGRSPIEIAMKAMEYLTIPGFKPEYFEIVDGNNLQKVKEVRRHEIVVACTAVWAGDIRLIDNMILQGKL